MTRIALSLLDLNADVIQAFAIELRRLNVEIFYFSNEAFDRENTIGRLLLFDTNVTSGEKIIHSREFNKIYDNDRSLKFYFSRKDALELMQHWYNDAQDYLLNNRITHVFMEGTPAHELVMELVCKNLSIQVLNLFHAPGPMGYMLISNSSVEYPLIENKGQVTDYSSHVLKNIEKIKLYSEPESKYKKAWRFLKRKQNYNYQPKWFIVAEKIKYPVRLVLSQLLSFLSKTTGDNVFYLHMDPERTVYNCGAFVSDQFKAIEHIANECDVKFCVKEHPVMIGRRSCRRLLRLYLNSNVSYRVNLDKVPKLAWTFSGSIAWERTFLNLKTVVLGKTYLHRSRYVVGYPNLYPLNDLKVDDFLEFLSRHVVEGNLVATNMNKKVMDENNIQNLAQALANAIDKTTESASPSVAAMWSGDH